MKIGKNVLVYAQGTWGSCCIISLLVLPSHKMLCVRNTVTKQLANLNGISQLP